MAFMHGRLKAILVTRAIQATLPAELTSTTGVLYVDPVPERACLNLFWSYEYIQ